MIRSGVDTDELEESSNAAEKGPKFMPKRMLTIVVPDSRKDKAVEALIRSNQTGKPGDGRIFVMPVLDAVRIRTGEEGDTAIDEQL
jgi:nitrogen regulatory protein PII 2